jgi:NAD(P)-dependent dehydrogenase (short-subunit alcohol dehydrogenase family)
MSSAASQGMGDLRGKTAIITGAARGLGLVMAESLAREGMRIAGVDVKSDELAEAMKSVERKYGVETLAFSGDIGEERTVKAFVAETMRQWGRVDVLVNNAGIRKIAPVWDTTVDMWDEIHNANLKGHFLCTREVLRQAMRRQNDGVIIFISSGSGKKGEEDSSAYCASKWGVIGFAESVAKDLKKSRIRTTTITPGMILTPMARESEAWDLGLDWLDPAAVSEAVVFCVKQDADTIIPELRIYHRAQV